MDLQPKPAGQRAARESRDARPPSEPPTVNQDLRQRMVERLLLEGAGDLAKPLQNCGQRLNLVCTSCGDRNRVETRCRKRWCPVCQSIVAREKLKRWQGAVRGLQWPLFVTLTAANSVTIDGLPEIKKAWAKFRRRKLIREKVTGGVASFEITNNGNGWHPHLHAILDCRWLSLFTREPKRGDPREVVLELCQSAKGELSSLWADQIGQSIAIVDVARIAGDQVTAYVLKYCAKPAELLAIAEDIAPLLRMLRKTRLIAGFGSLFPMPAVDEELPAGRFCECCGDHQKWIPEDVVNRAFAVHHDQNVGNKPRKSHFMK
jgi:hypothetical protein